MQRPKIIIASVAVAAIAAIGGTTAALASGSSSSSAAPSSTFEVPKGQAPATAETTPTAAEMALYNALDCTKDQKKVAGQEDHPTTFLITCGDPQTEQQVQYKYLLMPTLTAGGGRVLTVVGRGSDLASARTAAEQLDRVERLLWLWLLACFAYAIHPVRWLDTYLIAAWGAYFIAGAAFFRACTAGWNVSRAGLVLGSLGLCIVQAWQFAAELGAVHRKPFSDAVVAWLITSFFVFFAALSFRGPFARRAIPRWIATLGALSYPIYLLHQQIGAVVIQRYWSINNRYALLALAFAALLALAAAVHFGIERRTWAALRARGALALPVGRGIR